MEEIIIEQGGKYYSARECDSAEKLQFSDYEDLLKQEKWELYAALCYLAGYKRFREGSLFNVGFPGGKEQMDDANSRLQIFCSMVAESLQKNELQVEGNISRYSRFEPFFIKEEDIGCYVTPYEILKWAVLRGVILPWEMQYITRLIQYEFLESRHPYFLNGNKFKALRITDVERVTYQAIAEVLWFDNPQKNKADIELSIKSDLFLNRLGKASKYTGKNIFRGWLDLVDPREEKSRRGRPRKNNKKPVGIKSWCFYSTMRIHEAGRYCAAFDFEDFLGIYYDFRYLKIVINTMAATLFHLEKVQTYQQIADSAVLSPYLGLRSALALNPSEMIDRLFLEWIGEGCSLVKK
jgi:hypothetical protein